MIVILTGERGVGKSTACQKTVARAQARGYVCGGIITLSHPNNKRDVLDVRSGAVRQLTLDPAGSNPRERENESDTDSVVTQGRFRFDPATLAWANDAFTRTSTCHLFVVDELGPLELERGRGWLKALDVLRGADFTLALVVVRPELLEQARIKLPSSGATDVLTVTYRNRDGMPAVLLEILEREISSTAGIELYSGS
ncbi:MAG: nucleoside-triphosphatase [Chloroflexota bacterium]|nr:nucleoside-triphosphatase [Chloroflexota bacterium]